MKEETVANIVAWIQERRSRCPQQLLSLQPLEPALICVANSICDTLSKQYHAMVKDCESESSCARRYFALPILHYVISSKYISKPQIWLQALSEVLPPVAFTQLLNSVDETFGVPPITLSILSDNILFTPLLISHDVDPTIKCSGWFDRCALFAAGAKSNLRTNGSRLAALWLKYAPKDRIVRDAEGNPPLFLIQYRDEMEYAVKTFAPQFPRLGFDVNARQSDKFGSNTILHILAKDLSYSSSLIASSLISNVADTLAVNSAGLTAFQVALSVKNFNIAVSFTRFFSNVDWLRESWDTSKISVDCPTLLHYLLQETTNEHVVLDLCAAIVTMRSSELLKIPINSRGELVIPWALRQFTTPVTQTKERALRSLLERLSTSPNLDWLLDALEDGFSAAPAYFYAPLVSPIFFQTMLRAIPGSKEDALDLKGRNVLQFVLDNFAVGNKCAFLRLPDRIKTPQKLLLENCDLSNRSLLHSLIGALPTIESNLSCLVSTSNDQDLLPTFFQHLAKFALQPDAEGNTPKSLYLNYLSSHKWLFVGESELHGVTYAPLTTRTFTCMVHGHLHSLFGLNAADEESITVAFKFAAYGLTEVLVRSGLLSAANLANGILDTPHPQIENATLLTSILDGPLGKAAVRLLLNSPGSEHVEAALRSPHVFQMFAQKGSLSSLKLIVNSFTHWQPGQLATLISSIINFRDSNNKKWRSLLTRIFSQTEPGSALSALTEKDRDECKRLAKSIKNPHLAQFVLVHLENATPEEKF
jgi:hypothetical protein